MVENSLTARVVWKCLNHLPRRRRQSVQEPIYRPQPVVSKSRIQPEQDVCNNSEYHHMSIRKRPLTVICSSQDDGVALLQSVEDQSDSPLFKLPKEVRLLIYEQILGDRVMHIVRRRTKLGLRVCKGSGDFNTCISDQCRGYKIQTGICTGSGDGDIIQTLQSCRRVYSEAINVLYSSNIFNFDSLEAFVAFSCAILPQRLDSIRSLQLDFRFNMSPLYSECTPHNNFPRWERAWRIMATMLSLREIWMRFSWQHLAKSPFEEARILNPLRLVTGLKTFDVSMPHRRQLWLKDEAEKEPFRILLGGN